MGGASGGRGQGGTLGANRAGEGVATLNIAALLEMHLLKCLFSVLTCLQSERVRRPGTQEVIEEIGRLKVRSLHFW